VKGLGLVANTSYKIWIQAEPVSNNKLSIVDGNDPVLLSAYEFNAGNDPSGAQETVATDASGEFGPQAVWAVDPAAATPTKYDIVADSQALGTIGKYDSRDYIDAPGWDGFTVAVLPTQPPVAAFTADVTSGAAPLTVNFTDQSGGTPTTWAWDFNNDGVVDSTAQNPTYVYEDGGTYAVKLDVTNSAGSDSSVKTNCIDVTAPTPSGGWIKGHYILVVAGVIAATAVVCVAILAVKIRRRSA
jgi:PKD repeat protein